MLCDVLDQLLLRVLGEELGEEVKGDRILLGDFLIQHLRRQEEPEQVMPKETQTTSRN